MALGKPWHYSGLSCLGPLGQRVPEPAGQNKGRAKRARGRPLGPYAPPGHTQFGRARVGHRAASFSYLFAQDTWDQVIPLWSLGRHLQPTILAQVHHHKFLIPSPSVTDIASSVLAIAHSTSQNLSIPCPKGQGRHNSRPTRALQPAHQLNIPRIDHTSPLTGTGALVIALTSTLTPIVTLAPCHTTTSPTAKLLQATVAPPIFNSTPRHTRMCLATPRHHKPPMEAMEVAAARPHILDMAERDQRPLAAQVASVVGWAILVVCEQAGSPPLAPRAMMANRV